MSELSAFIWPQTSPVEDDETLGWVGWQQGLPRLGPHSPKATPALESPWISGPCRLTASRASLGRVQATHFSLGQPPPSSFCSPAVLVRPGSRFCLLWQMGTCPGPGGCVPARPIPHASFPTSPSGRQDAWSRDHLLSGGICWGLLPMGDPSWGPGLTTGSIQALT